MERIYHKTVPHVRTKKRVPMKLHVTQRNNTSHGSRNYLFLAQQIAIHRWVDKDRYTQVGGQGSLFTGWWTRIAIHRRLDMDMHRYSQAGGQGSLFTGGWTRIAVHRRMDMDIDRYTQAGGQGSLYTGGWTRIPIHRRVDKDRYTQAG